MRNFCYIGAVALLFGAAAGAQTRILTTSNTATNSLLVYDTSDKLVQTVATGGKGGASGNSGGIATWRDRVAVVNFGSITRDNDAYVTIAHANETSLVRDDAVVTTTGSGTQNSPYWLRGWPPRLVPARCGPPLGFASVGWR